MNMKSKEFPHFSLLNKAFQMANHDIAKLLDKTGQELLNQLRKNARITFKELGKRVNLTAPAVADRVQKMEEASIIRGYTTDINLDKLGFSILAIVHIRKLGGRSCDWVASQLEDISEVEEILRITGDDSMMVRIAAQSMDQLTVVLDKVSKFGTPETSILRNPD